jgi:hypothetical protein
MGEEKRRVDDDDEYNIIDIGWGERERRDICRYAQICRYVLCRCI